MECRRLAAVLSALSLLTGCCSLTVGASPDPSRLEMKGLMNGYLGIPGFPDYDGTIFQAHLMNPDSPDGEVASVGVWPLMNVGVGVVGARAQVGPLAAGAGVLFYDPKLNSESAGTPGGGTACTKCDDHATTPSVAIVEHH